MNTVEKIPVPGATRKQWLAVAGALLGAFMAILDISITNASMRDIQGGLSATLDEGAWISTAYLVAEIIVIPLTGYLSSVISLRRYLMVNTVIFLLSSALCGMARSLDFMIFARVLQGASGGVLIPLAITIILTHLPRHQQPIGLTLFGLAATFSPSIGPTIGGWLTVNYSWTWIFYLNLVPGAALLALIGYSLEPAPARPDLLKDADWFGIVTIALALGSLTVILEEGVREDWWASNLITALTWIGSLSFAAFLCVELTIEKPFINLRLLARRNFLIATVLAGLFGMGLYSSIFFLPYFLSSVQRLDAEQIGSIVMWQGLPQLALLPFVPMLVKRFDNRALLAFGLAMFATSALMNSSLTHEWARDQFFWSQLVRAIGQPLIITPLSSIAYFGIEPQEIGSASGLNNMVRNLGGSVGIGTLGALFNHQYHLHFTRLAEATSRFSEVVQRQISVRGAYLAEHSAAGGARQAVGLIYAGMTRESYTMSFGDVFLVIAVLLYAGALLVAFTRRPSAAGSTASAAH